jgi:predicted O-linked N-acetylglucosamine transferase (SPINDLY family)
MARQSASFMSAAGRPEFVAGDEADYVARAVARADDLEALAAVRAGLREAARDGLFNAARFTRALEEQIRGAWRDLCAKDFS